MTCEIQMLEEEVAAVHRYNEALAEGLRACSAYVGVELPSTERDLSDVAGRVQDKVKELVDLLARAEAQRDVALVKLSRVELSPHWVCQACGGTDHDGELCRKCKEPLPYCSSEGES